MSPSAESPSDLEIRLGITFRDRALLERAVTHSSFANEASRTAPLPHNETLEFLGDSILGFLVAELLFQEFPEEREGTLSKARSHLVSESHFASLARSIGLGDCLRLAPGEQKTGGRVKDSVLADAFEALFAAVYLDQGLEPARSLARRFFENDVNNLDPNQISFHDYKTALQELAQGEGKPLPAYRLVSETGPDHRKEFVYEVLFDEEISARGEGGSKKEAQRKAAKAALAIKLGRPEPL